MLKLDFLQLTLELVNSDVAEESLLKNSIWFYSIYSFTSTSSCSAKLDVATWFIETSLNLFNLDMFDNGSSDFFITLRPKA